MRKVELEDVLFPVDVQPIYRLNQDKQPIHIASHRTIVNCTNQQSLGVVSAGYRLVTNAEALDFARDCGRQLFGADRTDDLHVFSVYAPKRGWSCVIDLIHKGYEVNLFKKEVYVPFLRVTNSYNATLALRFDVGFCRKICMNGMIFEKEAIDFRFNHTRSQIGNKLEFNIHKGKLEELQSQFKGQAERLFNYLLPQDKEMAMFFKALGLPLPPVAGDKSEKVTLFLALHECAGQLVQKYVESMGRNGYALFNALTDFATHPPSALNFRRSTPAMQATVGKWGRELLEFLSQNETKDIEVYLEDYRHMVGWKHSAKEKPAMKSLSGECCSANDTNRDSRSRIKRDLDELSLQDLDKLIDTGGRE